MSKIEKALNRAREERRNLPVPVPMPDRGEALATGTALVADRAGHPETLARMAAGEAQLLSPGELLELGIIHPELGDDPTVEQFRELRTKIIQQSQGRNGVILVTGVSKGSGSSFVAQNLGAAFAFDTGMSALVIDCNLKNPSVHRLIADASAPGLTDYLRDPELDIAKIIHPVGIARYRAIAVGGRGGIPAEHFTSLKMRLLVDSIRRRYGERFTILDGPTMSDIADIRILSELSDYVLVVARYGRATNAQIENCLNAISDEKLLGIVFNDEPRIPWLHRQEYSWEQPRGESDYRRPGG